MMCSQLKRKWRSQSQIDLEPKFQLAKRWPCRSDQPIDLVAYDYYIRAVSLIDAGAFESEEEGGKYFFRAIELLNQAIARDSNFLLAYCRLAQAHDELYFHNADRTESRLALAKSAIDSAFRLKPDSGEAHFALGRHLYHGYLDYDRARDELAIALRSEPNNARIFEWLGYIDRRQNRWDDAARNLERAIGTGSAKR